MYDDLLNEIVLIIFEEKEKMIYKESWNCLENVEQKIIDLVENWGHKETP